MNVPSTEHVDSPGVLSNNFSLLSIKGELAMCVLITQGLTRDDRHMLELGIHHKQSECSKQHFAVAILLMEHR